MPDAAQPTRELTTEPVDDRDPLERLVSDVERIANALDALTAVAYLYATHDARVADEPGVTRLASENLDRLAGRARSNG